MYFFCNLIFLFVDQGYKRNFFIIFFYCTLCIYGIPFIRFQDENLLEFFFPLSLQKYDYRFT